VLAPFVTTPDWQYENVSSMPSLQISVPQDQRRLLGWLEWDQLPMHPMLCILGVQQSLLAPGQAVLPIRLGKQQKISWG
jgi:hypothetical protein